MSITSIIPNIIFGIVLIIAWLPVIYFTEKNNKGNNDEYKLLLDKLSSALILTDITSQITFPTPSTNLSPTLPPGVYSIFLYYNITYNFMETNNNNLYVMASRNYKMADSNGNKVNNGTDVNFFKKIINTPLVNNVPMNDVDYVYLAMQNKVFTTTTTDPYDSTVTYDLTFYSIPKNRIIMKVDGLLNYKEQLDMDIYTYEFGPEYNAKQAIQNRKSKSDTLQMWLGRIGTFLMLFIGLSLLVSPLRFINELGDALPGPLKLLAIPGKIILSIYDTLSFFGSLILTILMTFFIWSLINHPLISVFIGGMIVGLLLYFNKK